MPNIYYVCVDKSRCFDERVVVPIDLVEKITANEYSILFNKIIKLHQIFEYLYNTNMYQFHVFMKFKNKHSIDDDGSNFYLDKCSTPRYTNTEQHIHNLYTLKNIDNKLDRKTKKYYKQLEISPIHSGKRKLIRIACGGRMLDPFRKLIRFYLTNLINMEILDKDFDWIYNDFLLQFEADKDIIYENIVKQHGKEKTNNIIFR